MHKTNEYSAAVADAIVSLFREGDNAHPVYHFDLGKIDATLFFTGMVQGCNLVYRKLTGDKKSNLEFTHLCNHLVVQDMIQRDAVVIDDDESDEETMEDDE